MVWLVWVDRGTSSFASFSLCRSASAHQIGLPDLIKIQATQLNLNAGETEKKKKKERKKETGISISQILHGMYLY